MNYYDLTTAQLKEWNYIKNNMDNYPFNQSRHIGGYASFGGIIDFGIFKKAINIFVQKNDGMRLRCIEVDGAPKQYVCQFTGYDADFLDFSHCDDADSEFNKWLAEDFKKPFGDIYGDLYYFAVIKISENKSAWYMKIHHIKFDGWSVGIMVRQIFEAYMKIKYRGTVESEPEASYLEHIDNEKRYLSSERFIRDRAFWNACFEGYPPSFAQPVLKSASTTNILFHLEEEISGSIKSFCGRSLSLSTFFISVLAVYLCKTTQQADISIGSYMSNRGSTKEKKIVGCFANDMALRIKVNKTQSFCAFANEVNAVMRKFLFYSKYPNSLLAKDLNIHEKGHRNLYQFSVNYNLMRPSGLLDGMEVRIKELYTPAYTTTNLQIEIIDWLEYNDALLLNFIFMESVYSGEDIKAMYDDIHKLIESIIENSDRIIAEL